MNSENRIKNLDRLCDDIKELVSDSTKQSKLSLASSIYVLVELFNKHNDQLSHQGFILLMRQSGLPNFKMRYQQFRYLYNVGYLYNFCDQKLFCNCIRKGSELKNQLVQLDKEGQNLVKTLVDSERFVTMKMLTEFINVAKGGESASVITPKQKVENLKAALNELTKGLGEFVVYSPDMPRSFYVTFDKRIVDQIWERALRGNPTKIMVGHFIQCQTLFWALLDICGVLFDNKDFTYVNALRSESELYASLPKVDLKVPTLLFLFKREFLTLFSYDELKPFTTPILKELQAQAVLFEYMIAGNAIRTKPKMSKIFSEFY